MTRTRKLAYWKDMRGVHGVTCGCTKCAAQEAEWAARRCAHCGVGGSLLMTPEGEVLCIDMNECVERRARDAARDLNLGSALV